MGKEEAKERMVVPLMQETRACTRQGGRSKETGSGRTLGVEAGRTVTEDSIDRQWQKMQRMGFFKKLPLDGKAAQAFSLA